MCRTLGRFRPLEIIASHDDTDGKSSTLDIIRSRGILTYFIAAVCVGYFMECSNDS